MRETCGVAWLLFVRAGPLGAFVCGRFRVCRLRFRLALFVLVSRVVCQGSSLGIFFAGVSMCRLWLILTFLCSLVVYV